MTTVAQLEAKIAKNYPNYTKLQIESLTNYSFNWYKPINILLRTGDDGLDKYMNEDCIRNKTVKNFTRFSSFEPRIKPATPEIAIENVKERIEEIDSAFLLVAPRTKKKDTILWRGKKDDYYDDSHSIHTGSTGERNIEKAYISSTKDIDVAMKFVDNERKKSKQYPIKCCLYRMHIMADIPYIDMSHGLGQFEESELLLPRDLRVTRIENDSESAKISAKYKIKVIDIRIEKNRADQFYIPRLEDSLGATLKPSFDETIESKTMGGKSIKKRKTKKINKKRLMKRRKTIRRKLKYKV